MTIYTSDRLDGRKVREGEIIFSTAVGAANIVRDIGEMIRNTFGGRMRRYERLINMTIERALADLDAKAKEQGYDGCLAVRISHPRIAEGACEVLVYGTAFHFIAEEV